MKIHKVCFYGSTRITYRGNRNQIITIEGVDKNLELIDFGEKCLNSNKIEGFYYGETGTLYPQENISIVPFRYHWCTLGYEEIILTHLEDVIEANEKYIKSEIIVFPLMMLKSATQEGYNLLGKANGLNFHLEEEKEFKNNWCCFGHYYLYLLKKALANKGYYADGIKAGEKHVNLKNTVFRKNDGTKLIIHADAGM